MTTAVDSSVPNHRRRSMQRASVTESTFYVAPLLPDAALEQTATGEPAPNCSFVDLLLPHNTPPSRSMSATPAQESGSLATDTAQPPLTMFEDSTKVVPLSVEVSRKNMELAAPFGFPLPEDPESEEPISDKPMYPPPVSPTQTCQPPVRTLSIALITKSPNVANPPTSKFNRRSWLPSEQEYISAPASPNTDSSGKIRRSGSNASSAASSDCSGHSNVIQIPQPGTNAYSKRSSHDRKQSDPKYVRFMSAVSERQKQTEPERCIGYPGLVSHMTETQNLIFRRFDEVHVRLLLYLQDQISQLESQLRQLDEQNTVEMGMHNGTFREDFDQLRVEIMERLRRLVGEYDTMVLAFSRMQESKASEKAVGRLKDWLRKYSSTSAGRQSPPKGSPIAKDELEWVEKSNDLTNLSLTTTAGSTMVKQSPLTRLFPGKKR
jgi:hypothetical protein